MQKKRGSLREWQQFLSPNHYTGQQRGERGQGEARKPEISRELNIKTQRCWSCDDQHYFLTTTLKDLSWWLRWVLSVYKQHLQFNFWLKFLKFRKSSWTAMRFYKNPGYPLEKPQDGKKKRPGHEGFRGPCWPGEQTSAYSTSQWKRSAFKRQRGSTKRWGEAVEAKALPFPLRLG